MTALSLYPPLHLLSLAAVNPAAVPTIAFSSRTSTTIVVTHTPPADTTNYALTRFFIGTNGGTPVSTATSTTAENVTLSGLSPNTVYAIFAVSENATAGQLASSVTLIAFTSPAAGSSQIASIKAAIKTLIATVAGTDSNTIHTRSRRPAEFTSADQDSLLTSSSAVNAWFIGEENASSDWRARPAAWEWRETFVIWGLYEFDDANDSDGTYRGIVEDVIEALNADPTLSGTVRNHETVQVRAWAHQMLNQQIVHYVELGLTCWWIHKP